MLIAAALVPSLPALVPELNGADSAETEEVRLAASAECARLDAATTRWTVLGIGPATARYPATTRGTFAGFGVDLVVGLGPDPAGPVDPQLPVSVLVGAWLRGRVAPAVGADAWVVAADAAPAQCAELGAALRRELDAEPTPHGLLVVADGATTLTARAPGYHDPRAAAVQAGVTAALGAADRAALAALDPELCAELGITGRAAYQVLAGALPDAVGSTTYAAAPFGVAYHVGRWEPRR
ncbi:hypothetical protein [Skermania piniformis]|uniref:Uncharacterized protein n=1 Tax=Skermania pinensis TaxID=39122 RepID=A0ABX8SBC8_9ACTN|nr:hypothetical protein [Skermania piniformis]QXQ15168.1 hypothetical protein KV203_07455 [Skermania piniformis]